MMNDPSNPEVQEAIDREHLRMLAIFYYIMGGLGIFFACFALLYVAFGMVIALNPEGFVPNQRGEPPPAALGYLVAAMGGCFTLFGWIFSGLIVYVGHCIQQRKHRLLTMIVAGILCLSIPFGTILGVFTFIILSRPSVMRSYERAGSL